ncbi:MAG: SBBP repeat-containing protein [Candidatus Sulfotelmatobacter sp.]
MSNPATSPGWVCAFCIVPVLAMIAVALLVLSPARHRGAAGTASSGSFTSQPGTVTPAARGRIQASYAALPLAFEQNQGQTDTQVKYTARGNGYTLFLTANAAVFSLQPRSAESAPSTVRRGAELRAKSLRQRRAQENSDAVVRMQLVGGNSLAKVAASGLLPGKSNYFVGNDPSKWRTDVAHYARVSYEDVYPGVNMAFHGAQRQFEFDFVVAPGANPAPIGFLFTGAQGMKTDDSGNLVISSAAGDVLLHKPVAYQEHDGARQPVDARFMLKANNQVSFELGAYDRSRELVIDPSVSYEYSTYLGGSGNDEGYGIAFDSSGNAYVTGQTASSNFPDVGGVAPDTLHGTANVFVTKIAPSGSSLIYSTYVGGSSSDSGNGIAVDASGDTFVAGGTSSSNFPTTSGAFQTKLGTGATSNAFVFELNPDGTSLTYSTYLGGNGDDVALGIALDNAGAVYTGGKTTSTHFPTMNPFQATLAGTSNGFVTKLNSSGTALVYSTYLGGGTGDAVFGIAVDTSDNVYVTGETFSSNFPITGGAFQTTCGSCSGDLSDAFATKLSPTGNALVYSTFLGGSVTDIGDSIAVDSSGNAYVTGQTSSADFPLQSPLQKTYGGGTSDAFVTKLNPTGSALVYSTYLGGSGLDLGASIAIDGSNDAYLTGQTASSNFPTSGPTQPALGGQNDAFVSEINSAGSQLIFSTYLGGSADEDDGGSYGAIAVDSPGANIYVTGNTQSTNFPTQSPYQMTNAGGSDAFVVKYAQPPTFTIVATTPEAVAPGTSGTSTVTLTAVNGYISPVNLGCSVSGTGSPLPACSTTSFSPGQVTPTAVGATSTLTITTTAANAAMFVPRKVFYAMWLPIAGMSLVGIGFGSAHSRRRKVLGFLMIGMVVAGLLLMPACGGSSSSGGGGGGGGGGTPAGSYTVTITGTGTDTNTTTQSTQVTLTVN